MHFVGDSNMRITNPSLNIEKSLYLRNGLTDRHKI